MSKYFALVDCNNFFVSCERLFQPQLMSKPVVVLSNNDGCVISRSNEAKKLGIKMGVPYFQIKELCEAQGVKVFSSNFKLYGDLSHRVMTILQSFTPNIEIYSIDEAFLDLTGLEQNSAEYCREISNRIKKWTGIPVSIGTAPTKTLAKMANYLTKLENLNGNKSCFHIDLFDSNIRKQYLSKTDVSAIWGIGSKLSVSLKTIGIGTALDLANADPKMIRKKFSIVVEKIVHELNGFSCIEMEMTKPKQSITSSRSFGTEVSTNEDLEEAISTYVSRAAIKLREQNSYATTLYVYLETKFKPKKEYFSNIIRLETPTNHTPTLVKAAKKALNNIYKKGLKYKKCGIILLDLLEKNEIQDSFLIQKEDPKKNVLMQIIDGINKKTGKDIVIFASNGIQQKWIMQKDHCSNNYTSSWSGLKKVI